jgi:hypothetical protein
MRIEDSCIVKEAEIFTVRETSVSLDSYSIFALLSNAWQCPADWWASICLSAVRVMKCNGNARRYEQLNKTFLQGHRQKTGTIQQHQCNQNATLMLPVYCARLAAALPSLLCSDPLCTVPKVALGRYELQE